jgi:preprotein translocase subunit SecA
MGEAYTVPGPREGDLAPYLSRRDSINAQEPELRRLGDGGLRERAQTLHRRARSGEELGALLPDFFALVRETSATRSSAPSAR